MAENKENQQWHLDRRVPVSIILVLLVQLFGGAWIASQMRSDISRNAEEITANSDQIEVMRQSSETQAVQLGRIEEQIAGLRTDVGRLVNILDASRRQFRGGQEQ